MPRLNNLMSLAQMKNLVIFNCVVDNTEAGFPVSKDILISSDMPCAKPQKVEPVHRLRSRQEVVQT